MNKQTHQIDIQAPREKVWETLFGVETYPQWTKAFNEDSQVKTDWKKGSRALFTDGNGDGMVSRIAENIPNEFMSIEHLGTIMGGVEDTTSPEVQQWNGAHENYRLQDIEGGTRLLIEMDIDDKSEYAEMFAGMWPKALAAVKEISEKN
ncbi:SRPBCC family protein [Chitinophaga rhizosphaerae]|uniref:SRPBCC family protein n=1 Tax=Chitinophaga rhizosphaerae TaxID=1864947 RepID=UPI000F80FBD0|nr:SRPBCC domain-containing protein [Chitinophaga rhizosphaerae]